VFFPRQCSQPCLCIPLPRTAARKLAWPARHPHTLSQMCAPPASAGAVAWAAVNNGPSSCRGWYRRLPESLAIFRIGCSSLELAARLGLGCLGCQQCTVVVPLRRLRGDRLTFWPGVFGRRSAILTVEVGLSAVAGLVAGCCDVHGGIVLCCSSTAFGRLWSMSMPGTGLGAGGEE
jgi:hypothetical protein